MSCNLWVPNFFGDRALLIALPLIALATSGHHVERPQTVTAWAPGHWEQHGTLWV